MGGVHNPADTHFRVLLLLPFLVLVGVGAGLAVAAFNATGAANDVRYPEALPVLSGVLVAAPSLAFAAYGVRATLQSTSSPFVLRTHWLMVGVISIVAATGLLGLYATLVGDPEHYRGNFSESTQEWDPMYGMPATAYVLTAFGVATTFPLGVLAVLTKVTYIDAIVEPRRDAPAGIDPIGSIMRGR